MAHAMDTLTFEEFLAGETASTSGLRHEYVGGRAYAMSGGTERHDLAAGLLYRELAPGAERAGCRAFNGNRLLKVSETTGYYPDLMIVCGRATDLLFETDPTLVVEVLSPSTTRTDRREKTLAYCAGRNLQQYLLVHPDFERIEVAVPTPGGISWTSYEPGSAVKTPYGTIDVAWFYGVVDNTATT